MTLGWFFESVATVRQKLVVGHSDADCCVFVRDVLYHAGNIRRNAWDPWWLIYMDENGHVPPDRVWGPTTAAHKAGMGSAPQHTETHRRLGQLSVCQGWETLRPGGHAVPAQGDRGHTWFWLAFNPQQGVRIDSSRFRGVRVHDLNEWSDMIDRYPGGISTSILVR